MPEVRDNAAASRFELEESGAVAYAEYRREDRRWVIPYVYAPPELRGEGTAGRLMEGVATRARENMPSAPISASNATTPSSSGIMAG